MVIPKPKKDDEEAEEKEQKEPLGAALTTEQLQAYTGDYRSDELGVAYRLGIKDGNVRLLAVLDPSGLPRECARRGV